SVGAVQNALGPVGVGEVPVDSRGNAVLEGHGRGPAELVADLARIDRVATVMARAVAHEGDLAGARLAVLARAAFGKQAADGLHDLDVLALGVAPNVVDLSDPACLQHPDDGAAVVLHEQPVAAVL